MTRDDRSPATLTLECPDRGTFRLLPDIEPIPPSTITENSTCFFHLQQDDLDLFGTELRVDDLLLEPVALSPTHLRWSWRIAFHAGLATIELSSGSLPRAVFEVVTDPHRAKLTREEFVRMVGDILSDTAAVASLLGHRFGVVRGDTLLERARLERLIHVVGSLETAVLEIDSAPWSKLERRKYVVPIERAAPASARESSLTTRTALRRVPTAGLARLSPGTRGVIAKLGGCLPERIITTRATPDTRRVEHADILAALRRVGAFLQRCRAGLDAALKSSDSAPLTILRRKVDRMQRRVERLQQLSLFDGVTPTRGPIRPSHLFRRVPSYARFYRAYQDFLAGIGRIEGDFLNIPLRRTFELYELWCFMRLIHAAAQERGVEGEWKEALTERPDRTGLILTVVGKPFTFGLHTIVFKPRYTEVWRKDQTTVGSFSRVMIPDMAIQSGVSDTTPSPVLVIDAKYQVEEGIDDAISSIHKYRDALVRVDGDLNLDDAKQTVRAGFVLTPRAPFGMETGDWRDDDPPAVFFRDGYQAAFRFGAVQLTPGISVQECRVLLRRLLESTA